MFLVDDTRILYHASQVIRTKVFCIWLDTCFSCTFSRQFSHNAFKRIVCDCGRKYSFFINIILGKLISIYSSSIFKRKLYWWLCIVMLIFVFVLSSLFYRVKVLRLNSDLSQLFVKYGTKGPGQNTDWCKLTSVRFNCSGPYLNYMYGYLVEVREREWEVVPQYRTAIWIFM